jgi:dTDP-4-dehydrorhamnose reductase
MKKILVTGCNGQLGRAVNHILADKYDLVNTDVAELDITNIEFVLHLVRKVKPYAIINCAAHTAVDACESEVESAFRINALGPRNLSIAATESEAKLIHISTDYVFDGEATAPYTEFDSTRPTGVYGQSKLAGEHFVKEFARHYFILRTAWLYGEGKNFVNTMFRLAESNEVVRVVADQIGSPTSALEVARAIAALLPTDNYGLFHATCEGSCSWADLAEEAYRLCQNDTVVERISTAEFPTAAKRPAYSVLRNFMLELSGVYRFADGHDALQEFLM